MLEKFPALAPHCPWHKLGAVKPSNVNWCELDRCAWIIEPLNTWSNVFYILVGIWVIYSGRKKTPMMSQYFGWSLILLGFFSGIYHASQTFTLQILDFLGMFLVTNLLLVFNFRRLKMLTDYSLVTLYVLSVVGLTSLVIVCGIFNINYQIAFFFYLVCIVTQEYFISRKATGVKYLNYSIAIGFMVVAISLSIMDVKRVLCWPESLVYQGHAYWHVLAGMGVFFIYRFYQQFEEKLSQ